MTIKSNTLGHNDPRRDFVLENASPENRTEPDYDRELFELLGEGCSLIISTSTSEVAKILRFPKGISDEEKAERLVDILCNSNDGKLDIGQGSLQILNKLDLTNEQLSMARELVRGKIQREIRNRVTMLLNKLDGINSGGVESA